MIFLRIGYREAAEFLRNNDNYYIFTHANPDGDTVGSGFGLCAVLRKMGKKANVYCSDEFPKRYDYMYEDYEEQIFSPDKIIAVDIADPKLLGEKYADYGDKVDLCIDHHISNTDYAARTLAEPEAAAACQVIYQLFAGEKLAECDKKIASCLYTGIATDTGCFRFDCTSSATHIAAAELMKYGIDAGKINRRMFEQKSKARMAVEQHVLNTMEYYFDDKCSVAAITLEEMERAGLPADEFEGIAGLTTLLETVEVGIIIRQKEENKFKVSMRSAGSANVSDVCRRFGGGGHVKAAGCTMTGSLGDIKDSLLGGIAPELGYIYERH